MNADEILNSYVSDHDVVSEWQYGVRWLEDNEIEPCIDAEHAEGIARMYADTRVIRRRRVTVVMPWTTP